MSRGIPKIPGKISKNVKALVLFGPTASGKTAILERLFSGEKNTPAEIISADSMQVYRGMDIGTAKPSLEERAKLPHHLIDIRNPDEQFNAGDFVQLARESIAEVSQRGSLPVVSGGTGFYLKNLILGLPESPPSDPSIREAIKKELAEKGADALMEELKAGDPLSGGRIHANDHYRLTRALEVLRLTGRPLSSYPRNGGGGQADPAFDFLILGLRRNREELYRRINERASQMFRQGLPGEAHRLYEAGYTPDDPGLRAIGYREFFVEDFESGASNGARRSWRITKDLAGAEALIAMNSRRYAKRQIVFFASLPGAVWIDIDAGREDDAIREVKIRLAEFLQAPL